MGIVIPPLGPSKLAAKPVGSYAYAMDGLPLSEIVRLVEEHGGLEPRIFGSRARGEERADSDLDLLIKAGPRMSLLDIIGLEQDLEDLLSMRVEVVTEGGLHPLLRDDILREARPLRAA